MSFSIANLIVNLLLAIGLKYLWKMVSILQFVVFMRLWLVGMPHRTVTWLETLKTLALFEFLPT